MISITIIPKETNILIPKPVAMLHYMSKEALQLQSVREIGKMVSKES